MTIIADLPSDTKTNSRKSIELKFADSGGVVLLRELHLQNNEYFAIKNAFYKRFLKSLKRKKNEN